MLTFYMSTEDKDGRSLQNCLKSEIGYIKVMFTAQVISWKRTGDRHKIICI